MSVKVVQGLIGDVKAPVAPAPGTNQHNNLVPAQHALTIASNAATQAFISSEAVNVSIRSKGSGSGSSEKIKDYKEAKEVTDQVAEKIRTEDSAKDAHSGLSSASSAALT